MNYVNEPKCSGHDPCLGCQKKAVPCLYRTASNDKRLIRLACSTSPTITNFRVRGLQEVRGGPYPADDGYLHHFDRFASRNSFIGQAYGVAGSIQELSGLHQAPYLLDAVRAVGASQAVKVAPLGDAQRYQHQISAIHFYCRAVTDLREELNSSNALLQSSGTIFLWATFLLGLFEVKITCFGICMTSS